jgi:hypothetical protein
VNRGEFEMNNSPLKAFCPSNLLLSYIQCKKVNFHLNRSKLPVYEINLRDYEILSCMVRKNALIVSAYIPRINTKKGLSKI